MTNTAPYGDIFSAPTPALDRLGQQIYAQQRQRDLQKQQENKMLDEELSRNLSNISDADIPDLTKAYGTFKLKHQALMKKRGGGTPEEQLDVLRSKADMYDIINKGKTKKTEDATLATDYAKHPELYRGIAHDLILKRFKTPSSQLNKPYDTVDEDGKPIQVDLSDIGSFKYTPTTDFTKEMKNAVGTQRDLGQFDESTPGAVQKTIAKYKGYNSPYQAYNNLVTSLQDKRKADDFIKTHQFDPLQEQQITDRYNAIVNDPNFKKAYGLKGDEQFIGDDTELGKAAKMAVMLSTVAPTRDISVPIDKQVEMDKSQQNKINIEYLKNRLIMGRMQLRGTGNVNYNAGDLLMNDGNFDLSKPLQGVKISSTVTGKTFASDNVKYNPVKKEITYHDPISDSMQTVPVDKYKSIIRTINTAQDLKTVDNAIGAIDEALKKQQEVKKPTTGGKVRPPLNSFVKPIK